MKAKGAWGNGVGYGKAQAGNAPAGFGKGGPAAAAGGGKLSPQAMEALEHKFSEEADQFVAALTDCNIPSNTVRAKFEKVIKIRDEVLRGRGVKVPPAITPAAAKPAANGNAGWDMAEVYQAWAGKAALFGKGGMPGKAGMPALVSAPAAQGQSTKKGVAGVATALTDVENINWKGILMSHYGKEMKSTPTKEEFTFETSGAGTEFWTTVTCNCFGGEQFSSEVAATSKKLAEAEACRVVIAAKYPAVFQGANQQHATWASGAAGGDQMMQMMNPMMWGPAAMMGQMGQMQPPTKKQKTKNTSGAGNNPPDDNPKSQLSNVINICIGRSTTKDELRYDCTEEGGVFTCQVILAENDAGIVAEGAGEGETRKKAEQTAAAAALATFKDQYADKLAQHAELKKAKQAETLKALKESHKEKKAAKRAETETAE